MSQLLTYPNIQVNDIVERRSTIRFGNQLVDEILRGRVTRVEDFVDRHGEAGLSISVVPNDTRDRCQQYGFAVMFLYEAPREFPSVVEVIGHRDPQPTSHWSPKPGDVHYDLMC